MTCTGNCHECRKQKLAESERKTDIQPIIIRSTELPARSTKSDKRNGSGNNNQSDGMEKEE